MKAFELTQTASLFSTPAAYLAQPVWVGGWLTSARIGKKIAFLVLSDGSSHSTLQVVVPSDLLLAQPALRELGAGYSVRVKGRLVASIGSGQPFELLAECVAFVGGVEDAATYPIQPKAPSPEFLRSVPHLRSRTAQFGAIARLRHVLARAIHDHLEEQGFIWVATPILTSSDAEGAGDRLQVSGSSGEPFFDQPTYLTVSGQLEGEALCSALSRIYTFGPTFRAEKSHTSRHLAEFWMVEPEMAFADLPDIIDLSQGLLRSCVSRCLSKLPEEMAYFASQPGGTPLAQWEQFVEQDFEILTYTQAIEQLKAAPASFSSQAIWGMDLRSEHEKWLVEHTGRTIALVDYPSDIKSFYMKQSADGRTVEAVDILVPGLGEIIGGSVREDDLSRLASRMQQLGMDCSQYQQYLDLRRYGSVPHGGFGLGFERLVAYVASLPSIKDAIAYPRVAA
jgi:asparaginyl-tRNA synthetase